MAEYGQLVAASAVDRARKQSVAAAAGVSDCLCRRAVVAG